MWRKLPVWIRAVVIGIIVSGAPTIVWALLASINLRLTPIVPWSVPLMAAVLWLYWRYLQGDGPPRRLSTFRNESLRARPVTPRVWRLSLIGGGSAIAAVWALFAAFQGVLHIAAGPNDLTRFPVWTILAALVMGSAVAGIAEEAGFRGYMQLPLEREYGPLIAIATTSILFTLIHLTHGAGILPFLPFILAVAVVYGLLPFLTGSILPSITLHFAGDVVMLTMQYFAARRGVAGATGKIAFGYVIVSAALVVLSVLILRLLTRDARVNAPAEPVPAMGH